jgi:anionic cell wall polymer biosynthesis LytR-Cps2A-Psr (LCP) family protein
MKTVLKRVLIGIGIIVIILVIVSVGFLIKFKSETKEMHVIETGKLTNLPGTEYIFTAHYGYTADYQNAVKSWKTQE